MPLQVTPVNRNLQTRVTFMSFHPEMAAIACLWSSWRALQYAPLIAARC